ncbi:hypothetical protein [Rhizobium sp. BK251]|uniref:hypothetical protein n=1 Tax=Rhizobium sp. BK251 TaxID=2512125 RepID=UPI001052807F|nr:hypothetical protein [Rhizobium sp. BK251]TCL74608.1 hypothetical protein EV286_102169 [Rhizobium sp. BK251]
MQLIDPNHPVYRPLWVRLLIVAVCFGWAGLELATGDPFWAVLAGGAGAYSAYMLLLNFDPKPPETEAVRPDDEPEEDEPAEAPRADEAPERKERE